MKTELRRAGHLRPAWLLLAIDDSKTLHETRSTATIPRILGFVKAAKRLKGKLPASTTSSSPSNLLALRPHARPYGMLKHYTFACLPLVRYFARACARYA